MTARATTQTKTAPVIDEPCSLHLAAFERRHKQARAALQKALPKEEGGKA